MQPDSNDACSWCGRGLDPADCWLLAGPAEDHRAAFCRLEHIVPWTIRGPGWEPGGPLVLLRRRGDREITEEFASLTELAAWVKAGGPWAA